MWVAQTTTVLASYPGSLRRRACLGTRLLLCDTSVCVFVHIAVSSGGTVMCMLKVSDQLCEITYM